MGLLDFLRAKKKQFDERQWTTLSTGGFTLPFSGLGDASSQLNQYKNWVYACVALRAQALSEIELQLMDGDEEITDHALLDLMYRPNPNMTKADFFSGISSYMDLLGDSFVFLARAGKGKGEVKEMYLLRPDRMSIVRSKDPSNPFGVEKFIHRLGANEIPFMPNQVLHIPNFNPLAEHPFPYRGMSVVQAAAHAIETDNESRQWNYSFFQNSARPDGFLSAEGPVDEAEEERLKKMFLSEFGGTKNAHKVGLLKNGMKWLETTRSQKDMDFIEQRRFSRDEILALFGVPKAALGIVEDVNRANAEASDYVFASRTSRPRMQRVVDYLNEFLVTPEYGKQMYFKFKSPVPDDRVSILSEYTQGIDKWLTRNDIRRREGLDPTKEGDKIFGTLASLPIDEDDNPKDQKKVKAPKGKDEKKKFKRLKIVLTMNKRSISKEVREKYIGLWKSLIDQNAKGFVTKLKGYWANQEEEVQRLLKEEYGEKGIKAKGIEDVLFDEAKAMRAGISLITPFLEQWLKEAGIQATENLIGSDTPFESANPLARAFLKARGEYFAKNINEFTRNQLFDTLKEGVEEGENLVDLSKRVSGVYGEARDYRSDRIARTEVSAAANEGALEAYKQAGVEKHEWLVVNPQDTDCLANDGAVVKLGDSFPSGETKPPVHPNCECTTIPVFE